MPLTPLQEAVVQGGILSVISNILAQGIDWTQQGRDLRDFWPDWVPIFQFLLFSVISTPPNFAWQVFLEDTFPGYPPAPHPKKSDDPPPAPKLSLRNTAIKLLLDQSVSAVFNTLLFSTFTRTMHGAMTDVPRLTNIYAAISYWTKPGTLQFHEVDFADVWEQSLGEMWPLLTAAWRFWPIVAIINFTLVKSVRMRGLVGGLAGIAWGTYMSLVASHQTS